MQIHFSKGTIQMYLTAFSMDLKLDICIQKIRLIEICITFYVYSI